VEILHIENSSPKVRSIRTLKQWIQQGKLLSGEQLPAENELARLLSVSRTTVRAAVKSIEQEGLLRYNENHRRIVVGPVQSGKGLVSETIVILTHLGDTPPTNSSLQSQTGWERFIQIGLLDAVREARMHALTLQLDLLKKDLIKSFVAQPPRGLVVLRPSLHPSVSLELAIALRDKGVPVVFYGFTDLEKFDTVTSDSAAGSYELTKWLIKAGRRRPLRVWTSSSNGEIPEWVRQRSLGYERALKEAGLEVLPIQEYPDIWNPQLDNREYFDMRVRLLVGYLLEHLKGPKPIDAIISLTDGDCYAIAAACRILGKEPNKDIYIVGYDNYWQESPDRRWECSVPMATVDKLNLQLGHDLMDLMLERIKGKLPAEPQLRLVKPELKIIEEPGA
jgi:GntR family transcriptional regulator, arabinose operon transcriptional repressor